VALPAEVPTEVCDRWPFGRSQARFSGRPNAAALAFAEKLANSLIGLPYAERASGPDAYDCWGVARLAVRAIWGEVLPEAPIDELMAAISAQDLRRRWRAIKRPVHGAIGLTSTTTAPRHVVVYLANDRGGALHAIEGQGVVFWPLLQLRTYGFQDIRWYVPIAPSNPPDAMELAA
jgi:hypothetical protein